MKLINIKEISSIETRNEASVDFNSCTITLNNGFQYPKYFDTEQECIRYAEQIRSKCCNYIKLTEL